MGSDYDDSGNEGGDNSKMKKMSPSPSRKQIAKFQDTQEELNPDEDESDDMESDDDYFSDASN